MSCSLDKSELVILLGMSLPGGVALFRPPILASSPTTFSSSNFCALRMACLEMHTAFPDAIWNPQNVSQGVTGLWYTEESSTSDSTDKDCLGGSEMASSIGFLSATMSVVAFAEQLEGLPVENGSVDSVAHSLSLHALTVGSLSDTSGNLDTEDC